MAKICGWGKVTESTSVIEESAWVCELLLGVGGRKKPLVATRGNVVPGRGMRGERSSVCRFTNKLCGETIACGEDSLVGNVGLMERVVGLSCGGDVMSTSGGFSD